MELFFCGMKMRKFPVKGNTCRFMELMREIDKGLDFTALINNEKNPPIRDEPGDFALLC